MIHHLGGYSTGLVCKYSDDPTHVPGDRCVFVGSYVADGHDLSEAVQS